MSRYDIHCGTYKNNCNCEDVVRVTNIRNRMLISGKTKQAVTSKSIRYGLLETALRDDVIHSRCLQIHRQAPSARYDPSALECGGCPQSRIRWVSDRQSIRHAGSLTDIAPHWGHIAIMSSPYESVHGVDDAKQECAEYQSESGDVPSSQLRW
jgi:hypothetical protein